METFIGILSSFIVTILVACLNDKPLSHFECYTTYIY